MILIPLALVLTMGTSSADSTGGLQFTPESVIRYLHQDLYISPGVGFQKVQIGNSFQQVALAWGDPTKSSNSDIGGKTVWVYRIGSDSEIAVSGGTRVSSIEVTGSFNSSYATSEGANFGMTPHQVIGIYGKPSGNESLVKLHYPNKGITFGFKSGALQLMKVYSPD
ncbi:hypothetical protein ACFL1S_02135 [Pseudomonadota bacterium]